MSNKQKRKYQRLLNKINATSEKNLKTDFNRITISIHGTFYTFDLAIMNIKKSIGIDDLTKEEYPLLYKFLVFSKRIFSDESEESKTLRIRMRKKLIKTSIIKKSSRS